MRPCFFAKGIAPLIVCFIGVALMPESHGQQPSQAALDLAHLLDDAPTSNDDPVKNNERINALIELLGDLRFAEESGFSRPTIADRAMDILAYDLRSAALPALSARIAKETDAELFAQLTTVVGKIGIDDERLVTVLCQRGQDDDATIRSHVIWALMKINASGAPVDAVLLAGLKDADFDVVFDVLLAVKNREAVVPGATPILRKLLSDRSTRGVQLSGRAIAR